MNKKPFHSKIKLNKTAWILSGIAVALLILVIVLLLLLPKAPAEEVPAESAVTVAVTEAPTAEPTAAPTEPTETVPAETEPPMLPKMAELYAENPDIIGWITIPGTKVDYPVMLTPDEPEKYIHRNFKGHHSIGGVPFMEDECSMDPESDNLIIYGHNMKNGTQFKDLMNYTMKKYWEEHPQILFSTLYEERTYEIISAFYDKVYTTKDKVFKFYQFIDAKDEADFEYAVKYFKENGEYDTGVTAQYGDKLIMLVTCSYHIDDGRFVVVAKEITPEVPETVPAETTN